MWNGPRSTVYEPGQDKSDRPAQDCSWHEVVATRKPCVQFSVHGAKTGGRRGSLSVVSACALCQRGQLLKCLTSVLSIWLLSFSRQGSRPVTIYCQFPGCWHRNQLSGALFTRFHRKGYPHALLYSLQGTADLV